VGPSFATGCNVNSSCSPPRAGGCHNSKAMLALREVRGTTRRQGTGTGLACLGCMRELESSLQQFGEFLLAGKLVREKSAPHIVRWVRRFLAAPASPGSLADQSRRFCEELERSGRYEDWQVRQAEQAVRIYFMRQRVLASTQNQAFCSLLFRCRDVLGVDVDGLSSTVRARQGTHLPVVLSMPEVAALLAAMQGTSRLMATLIYGGGL